MKRLLTVALALAIFSCEDTSENTPEQPINDNFDPTGANVTLLKQGMITGGGGHTASGTVTLYDHAGKLVLVFDPFSTQNGPDFWVYLSTDEGATNYISLGKLKSTMGKQSYDVTGMPDLDEYKFALVWCQKYTVLVAKGELK